MHGSQNAMAEITQMMIAASGHVCSMMTWQLPDVSSSYSISAVLTARLPVTLIHIDAPFVVLSLGDTKHFLWIVSQNG